MQICQIDCCQDAVKLMEEIGVTTRGIQLMAPKALFIPIRLKQVDSRAANILKQTMLSQGAEAAVSRGTVNLSDTHTDVLILANAAQLQRAVPRLKEQPWGLKAIACELEALLKSLHVNDEHTSHIVQYHRDHNIEVETAALCDV